MGFDGDLIVASWLDTRCCRDVPVERLTDCAMTYRIQKQNRCCINFMGEYERPFVIAQSPGDVPPKCLYGCGFRILRDHDLLKFLETGGFDRVTLTVYARQLFRLRQHLSDFKIGNHCQVAIGRQR